MKPSLSIIVPTLQEEQGIAKRIAVLAHYENVEIIVCDGGSRDQTVAEAKKHAHQVLISPPGRARQMNLGAKNASSENLLFLHADCSLAKGFVQVIQDALSNPKTIAGCFQMRVQRGGFAYRCIEKAASARVKILKLIYGDQGLFLRRSDFERLGGFPELDFMEDLFFSRTLARHGSLKVAKFPIEVSARRWQKHGIIRQTIRNWILTMLAFLGVHPNKLARFYPVSR
jgi:rSAM/selenodomain-associated transferase 2